MKKQLESIKEENYDKKRPKSAKNVNNVINTTDNNKYTTKLDAKHKGIKKRINKNNLNNKDMLSSGSYNKFFKITDTIGFRVPNGTEIAFNKDFNAIFVSALLDICGEKTIDSGKEQHVSYFDRGKNDLYNELSDINTNHNVFRSNIREEIVLNRYTCRHDERTINEENFNRLQNKEKTIVKISLFTDLFRTDDAFGKKGINPLANNESIMQCLSKNPVTEEELKFASRFLCKIFLFQMYDRKADNVVVFEDKDGKIDFCEIDFDDNPYIGGYVSTIFCQTVFVDDEKEEWIKKRWNNKLQELINNYSELIKDVPSIQTSFKKMIDNYTMTKEKIEEVIKKTALKATYMGLNEDDVIDGINVKIELWKKKLMDKDNGKIVNQIPCVKEAREQTLEALNQIRHKDVEKIVKHVMICHDFTYKKPHFKDDNDVIGKEHKKTNEDIATEANKMIVKRKAGKNNNTNEPLYLKVKDVKFFEKFSGRSKDLAEKGIMQTSNGYIRYNKNTSLIYHQSFEDYKKEKMEQNKNNIMLKASITTVNNKKINSKKKY